VERDFWVEIFDRDGEGNIINIYQHRVNYDSKNWDDVAICGYSMFSCGATAFGSGLVLKCRGGNYHKPDIACRHSWILLK
jgi:hypothetical protein